MPHRRFTRKIVIALAAVMVASGVAPLTESSTPEVSASTIAAPIEFREAQPASRSQRAALTRKQKIEKVISYAYAQRGDRYKWGAAGPSRWDCSGLVSVAFKKGAGKSLPHYTGGIQKKGVKVSKKNLKRGDIIFPQRGHVGIYLGGGKMIHASSGKGKVVVAKVYGFYTARRVL
jgi:cell wall-associated NlpC family hydrolase